MLEVLLILLVIQAKSLLVGTVVADHKVDMQEVEQLILGLVEMN